MYHTNYLKRFSLLHRRNEPPWNGPTFDSDVIVGANNGKRSSNSHLFLRNYFDMSTLHGLRYFAELGRPIYERCFWMLAIATVIIGTAVTIRSQIVFYWSSPIVMSQNSDPSPNWEIPFPAVSICSENQARLSIINITDLLKATKERNLTIAELTYYSILTYLCHETSNDSFNFLLNECHVKHFSTFGYLHGLKLCQKILKDFVWKGTSFNNPCSVMQVTSHSIGFCFTFNMFPPKSLYTETYLKSFFSEIPSNILANDPYVFKDKLASWTTDSGYVTNHNNNDTVLPLRVTTGGFINSANYVLDFGINDTQEDCLPMGNGFLVFIHSPMELPSLEQPYTHLEVDRRSIIFLYPEYTKTDESLRSWAPEKRGCYYNNERTLLFFKYYSLHNCNIECDANFTLKMCSCNMFFQPRLLDNPICKLDQVPCYHKTTMMTSDAELNPSSHLSACNCLPSCSEVIYRIETGSQPRNWTYNAKYYRIPVDMIKIHNIVNFFVEFKYRHFNSFRRVASMSSTDFIANIGGLLGLFLGFSFVSAFELVYFCMVRWLTDFCNKRKVLKKLDENHYKNVNRVTSVSGNNSPVSFSNNGTSVPFISSYRRMNTVHVNNIKPKMPGVNSLSSHFFKHSSHNQFHVPFIN